MDEDLEWVGEAEAELIAQMRESVDKEVLAAEPVEIQHDLCFLRFLRGHGGNVEEAVKFYNAMLSWRLANREALQSLRAGFDSVSDWRDMIRAIPHAAKVGPLTPIRQLDGRSISNLPLACMCVGFFDLALWGSNITDEEFQQWMLGLLELRCMRLHAESVEQHKLVKFVDMRDLDGISITALLSNSLVLMRFKNAMKTVQDFYPETVHQILILNAPSTFSQLFAIFSQILNAVSACFAARALLPRCLTLIHTCLSSRSHALSG
jgi:hypothetical protein